MTISKAAARKALVAALFPLSLALAWPAAGQTPQKPAATPAPAPTAPVAPKPAEKPVDPDALPPGLAEMDTNNDKAVDQKEFVAFQMKTFDAVDANKDGFVTREEYLKQAEPPFVPADAPNLPPIERRKLVLNDRFTRLDSNQDGKISREEAEQSFVREFVINDRDQNGRLTANDLKIARAEEQAATQPERVTKQEFIENENQLFDRLDTNKDQTLSREEFLVMANGAPAASADQVKTRLEAAFANIDANKDGKLTKAEWQAFSERNFAQADRNKDGVLVGDELRPVAPQATNAPPAEITRDQFVNSQVNGMLAQFDKNKDGKISLDEFLTMASEAPASEAAQAKAQLTVAFDNLDTNKNKALERAELVTHFTNVFNRADTDKNGKLSPKEIAAAGSGGGAGSGPSAPAARPAAPQPTPKPQATPAPKPAPKPQPAPQPAPQGGPPPAYPPSSGGGQAPITTTPGGQPLR